MKWIVLPLVCVIWVESVFAQTASNSASIVKYAVVIGKNEPADSGAGILHYADDDAVAIHHLFLEAGIQSTLLVEPDNDTKAMYSLETHRAPTVDAVMTAYAAVQKQIAHQKAKGVSTEFILFYSGHGDVADGEGFVVLADGRLTREMLLKQMIAPSMADTNHVIIDACKSYFMVFDKGAGGQRRPFHSAFAASDTANLDRTGFVLSASSNQDSHEWERFQAGIFSYEVRSALRGGADADRNGTITYGELGAFVDCANAGIVNPRYRPRFLVQAPGNTPRNLDRSLLDWPAAANRLSIEQEQGHFYIETAAGIRIADIHTDGLASLTLRLPKSRPLFVRRADETAEGIMNHAHASLSDLEMRPLTISRKGALHLAFQSLFNRPFGAENVVRYQAAFTAQHQEMRLSASIRYSKQQQRKWVMGGLWGIFGGGVLVGGGLTLFAVKTLHTAETASQKKRVSLNTRIDRLNRGAVVSYVAAGIAGAVGIGLIMQKHLSKKPSMYVGFTPTPFGLVLGIGGAMGHQE